MWKMQEREEGRMGGHNPDDRSRVALAGEENSVSL